ncbi:MAG: nitroreductase family protein [Lachnospiraceae bacterium]|nr:nitroreductase family protein [Lachnospiraceae bacterium]
MKDLLELVRTRKSVRSFDGRKITEEDMAKLKVFADAIQDPFGIPVRFVFLDAEEKRLSSPVLTGERNYVAGAVEKKENADLAFGYAFERLVLYAWSLGIGTTWIGGTMKRALFEGAAGIGEEERMPCMSPLGYPAAKRSLKESIMRKGVGADSRMPAEKLFFEDSFDTPLSGEKQAEMGDLIELVRWAPSAVNKQPWRIVLKDGLYHFYEKHDKGYISDAVGDMQKIDVGIALCHFVMGLEESGRKPEVFIQDPGIKTAADTEYVLTVRA